MQEIRTKKALLEQNNSLQVHVEHGKSLPASLGTSPITKFFFPVSYPGLNCSVSYPGFFFLDLNIYREAMIKILIKEQNDDIYQLIKKVHFDGKYYRVKCVSSRKWEYFWDLAIQAQFFGNMPGLAFEPQKIVSRKNNKIIYRSLILINPYELWGKELVEMFWNLQERIEFLIAKILFHECIHILIFFGKTLPSSFEQTDIFLEFKEMLKFANSEKLCPESCGVQSSLRNLAYLTTNFSVNFEKKLDCVPELYEFLIHEKYSIKKTDMAFGFSWNNQKVSQNYAKLVALKLSESLKSNKMLWKQGIDRLQKNLEALYNRIDSNQALRV